MNEKDHIWIFDTSALATGIDGGFSFEYHLPGKILRSKPDEILDGKLWLVARNDGGSYLYAVLSLSAIEIYEEGKYKGDFLLHSEPFGSIRFLPRHEDKSSWRLPSSFDIKDGIRECRNDESAEFQSLITRNNRVSFMEPSNSLMDSIPKTKFKDLGHAVPDQITLALRTIALGDIARSRSYPESLSAFGGIVLLALELALPDCDNILATQLIVQMDPLSQLKDVFLESRRSMTEILALIPPAVDTFLEDIDPDKISPRMFVARSLSYTSDWLAKTEAAEQAHERILKDVVLHMKSKSFKVSKSRSFDLFSEKSSERLLWEVKSANAKNLTAQGEQGIIQLLRYSEALTDEKWIGVRFLLLLQDVGSIGINRYISKMAQRAGIELWLYDDKIEWPNRVYNIEKASFPGL